MAGCAYHLSDSRRLVVRAMKLAAAGCVALVLALSVPCFGHETDQYTLPIGREFVDQGDYLTAYVYGAIDRGVKKTNARIRAEISAGRDPDRYHTQEALVAAVNREFPYAIVFIEDMDRKSTSIQWKDRSPGYLPGYKPPPVFRINPLRAWNCGTMKVFGVYLGTDKLGHFTDMGKHYYDSYRAGIRRGESEEQALRRAVETGTNDPILGESGVLGYWTAGAFSNADLVANYMGMVFYRNLTEPQSLKGQMRPPLLVREGPYWKFAPHVRPDSDFLSWYFSEHYDEAANPSHYISAMREGVRRMAADNASKVLEARLDEFGNRRSQEYFLNLGLELRTYWGFDYGHRGTDQDLVMLAATCFPPMPADVRTRDSLGRTALHRAAEAGDVQLARKLLDSGAEVNAQVRSDEEFSSDWGNTPLHLATLNGRLEVVQLLLERGAQVNAGNDRGATVLHVSARHPQIASLLIVKGAKLESRDARGRTPLHWAAMGSCYETLATMLDKGAKLNARDNSGQTPLHLAANHGSASSTAELLARGADPKIGDMLGVTALHLAAAHDSATVVEALVHAGAPLDARDDLGCTALLEAVRSESETTVALLLQAGAQPSMSDRHGLTPLHVASRQTDPAIARLLLESGADASVRAGPRGTPIDEAIRAGNTALVSMLRDEESRAGMAASKRQ